MRINHRQIEAFRAVFQTASITAARALMGITQPAISRLIRDLEAETALTLFDRSAGKLLRPPMPSPCSEKCERSYQGLDRVARAAAALGRRREGALRIAASVAPSAPRSAAGSYLVPRGLAGCDFVVAHRLLAGGPGSRRDAALRPGRRRVAGGRAGCHHRGLAGAKRHLRPTDPPSSDVPRGDPGCDLAGEPMLMIRPTATCASASCKLSRRWMSSPTSCSNRPFRLLICALVAEGAGVSILRFVDAQAYAGPTLAGECSSPPCRTS